MVSPTRAVFYCRMSKDVQENSPGDQQKALVEYAKKQGYQVVGEYLDEGISGDATEKRLGFLKMISDCKLKQFEVILCWDQDRFGRFDPLEAGYWVKPMRDAGVVLETIAQGKIDWNNFASRLIWSVNQEGKHAFLRDLARNSLRGNINRAKAGKHTGRAPFGYVLTEDGTLALGDDKAVESVKRVFELRKTRLGYRMIGLKLTEEGHESPTGVSWSPDSVRLILQREIYTGTLVYGRFHRGKYSTTVEGSVGPAIGGQNIANRQPIRVENSHPAIIDRDTWQAIEALKRDPPKPHANSGNSGAPLAGLLRCGLCGGPMYSQSLQRKAGQKTPNYICGSYMLGRGCGYCFIGQAKIHELVSTRIRDEIFGGSLAALTESIRKKLSVRSHSQDASKNRQRLRKLNETIKAAEKRLLIVNEKLFAALQANLLELIEQRDALKTDLSEAPPMKSTDHREIATVLWHLTTAFEKLSPADTRTMIRQFIDHIDLHFTKGEKTGRGQSYCFTGFSLVFASSIKPCASPAKATWLGRLCE